MNFLTRIANINLIENVPVNQTYTFTDTTIEDVINKSITQTNTTNISLYRPLRSDSIQNRFSIEGVDNISSFTFFTKDTVSFEFDFTNNFSCITDNLYKLNDTTNNYELVSGPLDFNTNYYYFKGMGKDSFTTETITKFNKLIFMFSKKNSCLCQTNYNLVITYSNQY